MTTSYKIKNHGLKFGWEWHSNLYCISNRIIFCIEYLRKNKTISIYYVILYITYYMMYISIWFNFESQNFWSSPAAPRLLASDRVAPQLTWWPTQYSCICCFSVLHSPIIFCLPPRQCHLLFLFLLSVYTVSFC